VSIQKSKGSEGGQTRGEGIRRSDLIVPRREKRMRDNTRRRREESATDVKREGEAQEQIVD
jgi:hypothetical protein